MQYFISCNNSTTKSNELEYELLKPLFNLIPLDAIKKTFQLYAQHFRTPASSVTKKTHRSPFPELKVKRRSEPVATDAVHCDAPTIHNGSTCAKAFVSAKPLLTNVHGMKSDEQLVNSLEDNIR